MKRHRSLLAFSILVCSIVLFGLSILLQATRPPGNQVQTGSGPSDQLFGAALLAFAVVGSIVAIRRPDHRIGWLFCFIGGFGLLMATNAEYAIRATFGTDDLPLGHFSAWLASWIWAPWLGVMGFTLLVFPTGFLPSSRWRFAPFVFAAPGIFAFASALLTWGLDPRALAVAQDAAPEGASQAADIFAKLALPFFPASILLPAVSQVLRYRRARGEERQQLKWLAFAAFILISGLVLDITSEVVGGATLAAFAFDILGPLGLLGVPISIGAAILRYRLYDIDLVINKTFVYFALAAFITLIYVGVVVGVGSLVGAGDEPNLGLSLLATGLVAVAFQPVRERTQRIANRIVYGQRLSPYEAVTNFSHRMAESLSFEEILPSIGQAAANAVGGEQAKVKLIFPAGGSEEIYWPTTETEHTENSFDAEVEVIHQGTQVGEIAVAKKKGDALSPQEHKLLSDLASQAGLAFSNLRLTEELKAKLIELQESRRRIVAAQDEERRRMERDIHDGAQQQLVSMSVKLGLAKQLLAKDSERGQSMLEELKTEASEAVETLRDLARGLYPPILEEQGLVAALKSHIDKMGINATLQTQDFNGTRLDRSVEAAVYFVVREALQNASKHAGGSDITVELHRTDGELSFQVKDQGPGFDPTTAKIGSGVQNMRDRIEALDGTFEITSSLGQGATLKGRLPSKTMEVVA